MAVPLIKPDLPALEDISEPLREILGNGRITNFAKYNAEFESEASRFLGVPVATTSSGTAALLLTLQALGVGEGARVALPSFTFMATAQAVVYAGATPVFVDIDDDLTMSPIELARTLDRYDDVACVIPVHMYGMPAQTSEIERVTSEYARRHGRQVRIMYDAAHAFGSSIGERKVGTFGDAEVFSLSVTKALVTVEGGLVSSHNEDLIARIRKMRNYGIESSYDAWYPGLNSKMSEFHAIVGLFNIRRVPSILAARQTKAKYYTESIRKNTSYELLPLPPNVTHTFKDFTVLVPAEVADQRDAVIAFLRDAGIECRAYFSPPVHQQRFFKRFADQELPKTDDLSARVITLPFYTTITHAEMDEVVQALRRSEAEVLRGLTRVE